MESSDLSPPKTPRFRILWVVLCLLLAAGLTSALRGQDNSTSAPAEVPTGVATNTPEEQLAALQLELTNAWKRVLVIVNQPVQAYVRTPGVHVAVSQHGWFDVPAATPNFDTVDVRQTQSLPYKSEYVTSDLNPGVMYRSADLEFNHMTKFFYTDLSLPKHRLTEAQMLEVNRLYRIIGRCRRQISRLENPIEVGPVATDTETNAEADGQSKQPLAVIQRMPREKRLLYGGIAIGALMILVAGLRMLRRNRE